MIYNFKKIEKKWQKKWEEKKIFDARIDKKKKKFYCLEMFPYPSGKGLHIGHVLNYTIGDIYARFKKMNGFNVIHPMGYDAFGLPAENAAISVGEHPKKYTKNSIDTFMKQQKALGLSYDWDKTLATCEPDYYKWNQFFFLKLLEKGLVYRKKAPVNWCPKCNTVLANEQVQNGKCWRHEDTEVEVKHLEQWFIKITNYADELLDNIDNLDWPEKIKLMQKNWIGRSEGVEIDFEIESENSNVIIVHGCPFNVKKAMDEKTRTYDKHWIPWVKKQLEEKDIKVFTPLMPKSWEPSYEDWKNEFNKLPVNENSILIGHSCGGAFLVRWLGETKKKVKKLIFVSPSVVLDDELKSLKLKELYDFEINEEVKANVEEIIAFVSDNDKKRIEDSADLLVKKLSVRLIEVKGCGHFIEKHMGTKEFPELLDEIISKGKFPVFTTRPDTIYGVTFMVISAQHEKLMGFVTKGQKKDVEKFLKKIKVVSQKSKRDSEFLNKEGVFTGSYAINPVTKEKVPVYAGNFVVADYGSGMVMAVPAHDQRDFDFAKKYGIKIKQVIVPSFLNKDTPPRKDAKDTKRNIIYAIVLDKSGKKFIALKNKKFPWLTPVIGGIEEGEGSVLAAEREIKEETGYQNFKLERQMPYQLHAQFYAAHKKVNRSVFSNVFVFRLKDEKTLPLLKEEAEMHEVQWLPVSELRTLYPIAELDEIIKWFNEGYVAYAGSGKLINSEKFNNLDSEKAKKEIIKFLIKNKIGKKTTQFKLKDWLISRQRYWGTPIPIVYCDKCGIVPIPEKDLPVILPDKVQFGKGNPLKTNKAFLKVKCPRCNGEALRETDTMDTFFDSSWYFLRFLDNKNSKKPFDNEKTDYWMPVDKYIGGAEHACMHLIYARFFTKILRDFGFIGKEINEPFKSLFNQGMLHASDGRKMSKSFGNVINPLDVIKKYGADSLRLSLVSFASPDKDTNWNERILIGNYKFLSKVYEKFIKIKIGKSDEVIEHKINKAIKQITDHINEFKYNLAIIKLRELFDAIPEKTSKDVLEKSLQLLHLFCPHITEELWEKISKDKKEFISLSRWPKIDEFKINENIEKQESFVDKLIEDIHHILKIIENKQIKKISKVFVYALPNEKQIYLQNLEDIKKRTNLGVEIFSVTDSEVKSGDKDPEKKSKKAKPGKPGIYFE